MFLGEHAYMTCLARKEQRLDRELIGWRRLLLEAPNIAHELKKSEETGCCLESTDGNSGVDIRGKEPLDGIPLLVESE